MVVDRPRPRLSLPRTDVVLVDSLYAWTVAIAMRRRRSRPIVVAIAHQHPGGVDGPLWLRSIRRRVDLATYRRCDLVVSPGPILANALVERHAVQTERIEIIEPGSDLPQSGSVAPLRADRRIGLLNVANWLPNKGIIELLDAVAGLPRDEVTVHLVGRTDVDRRYSRRVRHRTEQPDLADRVVVHGALSSPDVAALYAAADLFAFPSSIETYGTAVAEALAAGLPIVGWQSAHLNALVDEGVEGLLVEHGRVDELAAAIHRLATDPSERQRLAAGARRRGARLPTWEQTTNRFFAVLARLVAGPVEPSQHPTAADDVDAADAGVLHEQMLGERTRVTHRPGNGCLDRADVGHDDHH